jgi:ABC-type transport system involved in multi-copper enzyme maturation permease subunit
MRPVFIMTMKGIFRDRVFQGILLTSVIFFFIPSISTLSMRQVTELSLTLSLSLISFILFLLSVFLGGSSIWKDMEHRYTYSVLGLPLARGGYILGKFMGIACFILLTTLFLGGIAGVVVWYSSNIYPPFRPVVWSTLYLAILFEGLKYVMLVAVSFLLSSVSTSFFLPIFGTISVFMAGNATQQVYEYVHSPAGTTIAPLIKNISTLFYYVLPNFDAFNLKIYAVYSIPPEYHGLLLTSAYFLLYTLIVLSLTVSIFSRRELQ